MLGIAAVVYEALARALRQAGEHAALRGPETAQDLPLQRLSVEATLAAILAPAIAREGDDGAE